jgi:hypothetical protein
VRLSDARMPYNTAHHLPKSDIDHCNLYSLIILVLWYPADI